jgi:hypothetical protein
MSLSLDVNVFEALLVEAREQGVDPQDIVRAELAEALKRRRAIRGESVVRTGAHAYAPVRTGTQEEEASQQEKAVERFLAGLPTGTHAYAPGNTGTHRYAPVRTGEHEEPAPPPPLHPSSPLSISLPLAGETGREEVQEEGGATGELTDSAQDREVFTAWCETLPHGGAGYRLNAKRREKLRARRREGYKQADLLDAVRGWPFDPWEDRPGHNDLAVLLRDGSQVEKFAQLFRGRKSPTEAALPAGGSVAQRDAAERLQQEVEA